MTIVEPVGLEIRLDDKSPEIVVALPTRSEETDRVAVFDVAEDSLPAALAGLEINVGFGVTPVPIVVKVDELAESDALGVVVEVVDVVVVVVVGPTVTAS
jgi:hypothetical protein